MEYCMIHNFFYLVRCLSLLVFISSLQATNFVCALDEQPEVISVVRNNVISNPGSFYIDKISIPGKIIVSLTHPGTLDPTLIDVPSEFNIKGQLPKGLIDFINEHKERYFHNLSYLIENDCSLKDFIFTGSQQGGEISLLLSTLWVNEFIQRNQPLRNNQVKSITFSVSSIGNSEFNHSMKRILGETNILDFSNYFTKSIGCGVPIYFLPDEYLVDKIHTASYINIFKRSFLVGLLMSPSLLSNSTQNLFIPSNIFFTLCIGIHEIYKNYPLIPSERLVLESFRYTHENYHSDLEASFDSIGRPSLLSLRRGLGSWVRRLIGF